MATPKERLIAALEATRQLDHNHFATLQRQIDLIVAYLQSET